MERNNLKDIINGSMKIPEQELGRSMWKSNDLDARMEIIKHLSDEQVDYVRNLQTTNKMWEYLRKIHKPSGGITNFFSFRSVKNRRRDSV